MNIEVKTSKKPVDYKESIEILEKRVEDVLSGKKKELLWILEHNTVYTGGISFKKKDIINNNIKVIKTNRGGKITVHSPGQKIVYFVLNLNNKKKDIRRLITKIEKCIIEILKEYKIKSYSDRENIGIWIDEKNEQKKIAAIGIKVKKWVAYHGFSINVCNDLSKYKSIIPCGIKDKGITSIKNLNIKNYDNIDSIITNKFLSIFL